MLRRLAAQTPKIALWQPNSASRRTVQPSSLFCPPEINTL
jgi:hypothetical protein